MKTTHVMNFRNQFVLDVFHLGKKTVESRVTYVRNLRVFNIFRSPLGMSLISAFYHCSD